MAKGICGDGEAGLDTSEAAAKLKHWQGVQADFIDKTGFVRQYEREQISSIVKTVETAVDIPTKSVIMQSITEREGVAILRTVGRIDIEKYRCVVSDIKTDEVIITDERIAHIQERHPNDYERFCSYIPQIIADPDYIIEANKPNTAVVLKEIEDAGEKFKLVLRLKVEEDPDEYKNSIMSFWFIGDKTWRKTIKNKKVLYKKE